MQPILMPLAIIGINLLVLLWFIFRNKNIVFAILAIEVLTLSGIYFFITPLIGNLIGQHMYYGVNTTYWAYHSLLPGLAFLTYINIGIALFGSKPLEVKQDFSQIFTTKSVRYFFLSIVALLVINFALVGKNLISVFAFWMTSTDSVIAAQSGYSNYLNSFFDTLIVAAVLVTFSKMPWPEKVTYLCIALGLFVFHNFRYRIILFSIMVIFIALLEKKIVMISWRTALYTMVFMLSIYFITNNRILLGGRHFKHISFLPNYTWVDMYYRETCNYLTTSAHLGYRHQNGLGLDWGRNSYIGVPIRALPKFLFPNKQKTEPLFITNNRKIFATLEGQDAKPAITGPDEAFLAFGHIGVFLAATVWVILAVFLNRVANNTVKMFIGIVLLASFFNWFTRGFFPQYFENIIYLVIPLLIIYKIDVHFRKNSIGTQSQRNH